jgi:hypothetical protein
VRKLTSSNHYRTRPRVKIDEKLQGIQREFQTLGTDLIDQLQSLQRKMKMWLVDLICLEKRRRMNLRKISLQISAVQWGGMYLVFSPVSFSPVSVSYHNNFARGSERHPDWGALSNKRRVNAILTLTWWLNGQGAFSDEPLPTGFDGKEALSELPTGWIVEHGDISIFIRTNSIIRP